MSSIYGEPIDPSTPTFYEDLGTAYSSRSDEIKARFAAERAEIRATPSPCLKPGEQLVVIDIDDGQKIETQGSSEYSPIADGYIHFAPMASDEYVLDVPAKSLTVYLSARRICEQYYPTTAGLYSTNDIPDGFVHGDPMFLVNWVLCDYTLALEVLINGVWIVAAKHKKPESTLRFWDESKITEMDSGITLSTETIETKFSRFRITLSGGFGSGGDVFGYHYGAGVIWPAVRYIHIASVSGYEPKPWPAHQSTLTIQSYSYLAADDPIALVPVGSSESSEQERYVGDEPGSSVGYQDFGLLLTDDLVPPEAARQITVYATAWALCDEISLEPQFQTFWQFRLCFASVTVTLMVSINGEWIDAATVVIDTDLGDRFHYTVLQNLTDLPKMLSGVRLESPVYDSDIELYRLRVEGTIDPARAQAFGANSIAVSAGAITLPEHQTHLDVHFLTTA